MSCCCKFDVDWNTLQVEVKKRLFFDRLLMSKTEKRKGSVLVDDPTRPVEQQSGQTAATAASAAGAVARQRGAG